MSLNAVLLMVLAMLSDAHYLRSKGTNLKIRMMEVEKEGKILKGISGMTYSEVASWPPHGQTNGKIGVSGSYRL